MPQDKPLIVAIDDEVEFTAMMSEYFSLRGFEIYIANKGATGIELIKEKKPDVLILDLKMPGLNGDEILTLARRGESKAQVIFVTAFDDGGKTKARLLAEGAYAYLDKPLPSIKMLEEAVIKAYGERSKN
ncbi:MAG: response regulator [Candidatus Omnitrophica bacterium]|nr:response regulator [Candidatus Omnitrophota bacterium]